MPPKGGKWWRLKYRARGKGKRLPPRTYPDIKLGKERKKRDEARRFEIDPSQQKKTDKAAQATRHGYSGKSFNW